VLRQRRIVILIIKQPMIRITTERRLATPRKSGSGAVATVRVNSLPPKSPDV
jgi:hypothetical protein